MREIASLTHHELHDARLALEDRQHELEQQALEILRHRPLAFALRLILTAIGLNRMTTGTTEPEAAPQDAL